MSWVAIRFRNQSLSILGLLRFHFHLDPFSQWSHSYFLCRRLFVCSIITYRKSSHPTKWYCFRTFIRILISPLLDFSRLLSYHSQTRILPKMKQGSCSLLCCHPFQQNYWTKQDSKTQWTKPRKPQEQFLMKQQSHLFQDWNAKSLTWNQAFQRITWSLNEIGITNNDEQHFSLKSRLLEARSDRKTQRWLWKLVQRPKRQAKVRAQHKWPLQPDKKGIASSSV